MQKEPDFIEEGKRSYQRWRDNLLANPETRKIYEEEAAKKELWLQLVEARQRAGISQAELARMEKRGYDAYTLNSLRRYVQALGEGFSLDIAVRWNTPPKTTSRMALNH